MDQELKDWEENPHLYLQDNEGNFVLKKDGTPRKKGGRPNIRDQAKLSAQRTITRKQKNIQKLENKLKNAKQSFKKQKDTLQDLSGSEKNLTISKDLETKIKGAFAPLKFAYNFSVIILRFMLHLLLYDLQLFAALSFLSFDVLTISLKFMLA